MSRTDGDANASKIKAVGLSKDHEADSDFGFGSDADFDGPDLAPVFDILDNAGLDLDDGEGGLRSDDPDHSKVDVDDDDDDDGSIVYGSNIDTDTDSDIDEVSSSQKIVRRMFISLHCEAKQEEVKSCEAGMAERSNPTDKKFEAITLGCKSLDFSGGSDEEADQGIVSDISCASPDIEQGCGLHIGKASDNSNSPLASDLEPEPSWNKLLANNIAADEVHRNKTLNSTQAQSGAS